jgi:hypothetical protein
MAEDEELFYSKLFQENKMKKVMFELLALTTALAIARRQRPARSASSL